MKSVREFQNIFIHREPIDMRKAINGLCGIVQFEQMGDLMGPHLFVFCGKRRDSIKILYFDGSGFCLWQKRLEIDKFPWPKHISDKIVHVTSEQFAWLLEGYDIWKIKPFSTIKFDKVC